MQMVSIKKASEVTGISTKKIARLVKTGVITSKPCIRDLRITLIDLTELYTKLQNS
jgi:DNA-binding MarR family transcriptional regulator